MAIKAIYLKTSTGDIFKMFLIACGDAIHGMVRVELENATK